MELQVLNNVGTEKQIRREKINVEKKDQKKGRKLNWKLTPIYLQV